MANSKFDLKSMAYQEIQGFSFHISDSIDSIDFSRRLGLTESCESDGQVLVVYLHGGQLLIISGVEPSHFNYTHKSIKE
jgi:hypothetical protein